MSRMNPDAPPFIPTFARSQAPRRVYNRAALKTIELNVIDGIRNTPLADMQSSLSAPRDFVTLLEQLPHAVEVLDVAHVVSLVQESKRLRGNGGKSPHCTQCREGPEACAFIRGVIAEVVRRASCSHLGAMMLQSGNVVWGLLQIALVFEARQSSLRLRSLAERHPAVVERVREFLCGEGYHLHLPRVTSHDEWQILNSMLRFDWIRDSRTRIFTEISKRWKKRHTQFEQFVHFFEYRDARPVHPVKNMLTHSTKPVFVSILSGDVRAVVLLARLGFFVLPDYYWDIFPFFTESLLPDGSDGELYDLMRHLCMHLAERQHALVEGVFNPIAPHSAR